MEEIIFSDMHLKRSSAAVLAFGVFALTAPHVAPMSQAQAQESVPELNWQIKQYGIDKLHQQGLDGSGQTIAIFEGGVDLNSPDLQGADIQFVEKPTHCKQFPNPNDPRATYAKWHGTSVASLIVGQGGEGKVQGVAPRAKLVVIEEAILDSGRWPAATPGCEEFTGRPVQRAEPFHPTVYSASLLGLFGNYGPYLTMTDASAFQGAGNDGEKRPDDPEKSMSDFPGSIIVGAAKHDRSVSDFSSRKHDLAFIAPGEGIVLRDVVTGKLKPGQGTSYATPYSAGVMALAKQKWPEASDLQLQQSMARTAFGANGTIRRSPDAGAGHIDPTTFVNTDPSSQPVEPPFLPVGTNNGYAQEGDKFIPYYNLLDGITACEGLPKCVDGKLPMSEATWLPPGAKEHMAHNEAINNPLGNLKKLLLPVLAAGGVLVVVLMGVVVLARRRR